MKCATLVEQQEHDRAVYGPLQEWCYVMTFSGVQRRSMRRAIAKLRLWFYEQRLGPVWCDTTFSPPRVMRGDLIIGTVDA